MRWQHPIRGQVLPGAFKVAVDLSPRRFQQADLPERVRAILTETGLPPERLELEITETVIITDVAQARIILRRLKSFGICIATDDIGTGYASLATPQAFPFDTIKIDRSFVSQLEQGPAAAMVVRAVLSLGRSLGIGVVAEGVETAGQMRVLLDEGCEEMQDYLFAEPQPVARLAAMMAQDAPFGDRAREPHMRAASR